MPTALRRWPTAVIGPVGLKLALVLSYAPNAARLTISSGMDGDHGAVSHHYGLTYQGSPTCALDIIGTAEDMRDLSKWIITNFAAETVELIHTTPFSDDNGFYVQSGVIFKGPPAGDGGPYASLIASSDPDTNHTSHAHWAAALAGIDKMLARLTITTSIPPPKPTTPAPLPTGGILVADVMDVWVTDVSDWDYTRGPLDMRAIKSDGVSGVLQKASEGDWTAQTFPRAVVDARTAGIPVLGAYHVLWPGQSVPDARHFFQLVNTKCPWWVDVPWVWMADAEKLDGMPRAATPGEVFAFVAELRRLAQGRGWYPAYMPQHTYGDTIPLGVDLWASDYRGSGAPRPFREQYAGITSANWAPYSGRDPLALQFAEDARVGTQQGCDISRVKGTLHQLIRRTGKIPLSSTPTTPTTPPAPKPPESTPVFDLFPATGRQTWRQIAQTYQTGDMAAQEAVLRKDNGGATTARPAASTRVKVRKPHRRVVIVQEGDSLSSIAAAAGVTLAGVVALNRHAFPDADVIYPGDPVRIS